MVARLGHSLLFFSFSFLINKRYIKLASLLVAISLHLAVVVVYYSVNI